jgi:hypothetical protein
MFRDTWKFYVALSLEETVSTEAANDHFFDPLKYKYLLNQWFSNWVSRDRGFPRMRLKGSFIIDENLGIYMFL